jgi:large subunit ribosomal protein L29
MRDSFKDFSYKELTSKKDALKKKYKEVRFNVVVGHVENTVERRILRRKIARINTLIHEFKIGIRKQ